MTSARQRIESWYEARGWDVLPFQRQAWSAFDRGASGLIHAPTGTGKTLAAWLGPVASALDAVDPGRGLQVLWITPLRALAADTRKHLQASVDELELDWSVGLRTGDTTAAERAKQRRRLPHALITTPESLSLLLSDKDVAGRFGALRAVVVDEWHELLGSKRGVQLELCLSRLRSVAPAVCTWGLSATLGNLTEARDVLLGTQAGERVMIDGPRGKNVTIRSVIPPRMERFPWAGHLGLTLLPSVLQRLDSAETTLLFTNTRSQAEVWHRALIDARPDWADDIALHHGSVDGELRRTIEQRLRDGEVRCVVCTSSLDLGVDFHPVEQVIQVGSPKGVARLMQRAGRSGHRPFETSTVHCVPSHAFELVEIAAARRALDADRLEARRPLRRSLDVLAQHLVTLALGDGFDVAGTLREVRTTHAFAELSDAEWMWVLDFITRGGQALQGYPEYRRVEIVEGVGRVTDRKIATRHRMTIGTITSDADMSVRWASGGRLGSIEETFIARLRRGDTFLFAGRTVELVRIKDMTAYVRRAKKRTGSVPRWQGGRMPLSSQLARAVLEVLADGLDADDPELQAVRPMLALQSEVSALPAPDVLLVEHVESREGHSVFFFPFAGRLAHEGLALLVAYRLSQRRPSTYTLAVNDYGFELLGDQAFAEDEADIRSLFSTDNLVEDILACSNMTEAARRRFRDIARIAGLVFPGYPGRGKTARQVQASSGLLFDVFERYDSENQLLEQARREVLEDQLDLARLGRALARVDDQRVVVTRPARLTPLAFPLWAERLQSTVVSSERWRDRVMKMAARLERAAERSVPRARA